MPRTFELLGLVSACGPTRVLVQTVIFKRRFIVRGAGVQAAQKQNASSPQNKYCAPNFLASSC